jgi:hypothetical protein
MPDCKRPAGTPYCTDSKKYKKKEREVYHDYFNCPDGKRIKTKHLEVYSPPPTRGRCDECAKMDGLPDCP